MRPGVELEWLHRAVELSSRSAVAYKAAFMLTPIPRLERHLLDRCTECYVLLERLLGVLLDQGMATEGMRAMLERLDMDPARHERLESALAEARSCDRELGRMMDKVLSGELRLPAGLEAYLAAKRPDLQAPEQERRGAASSGTLDAAMPGRTLPTATVAAVTAARC
jgi:hypothetical protein